IQKVFPLQTDLFLKYDPRFQFYLLSQPTYMNYLTQEQQNILTLPTLTTHVLEDYLIVQGLLSLMKSLNLPRLTRLKICHFESYSFSISLLYPIFLTITLCMKRHSVLHLIHTFIYSLSYY